MHKNGWRYLEQRSGPKNGSSVLENVGRVSIATEGEEENIRARLSSFDMEKECKKLVIHYQRLVNARRARSNNKGKWEAGEQLMPRLLEKKEKIVQLVF